jgi:hypothetical protein
MALVLADRVKETTTTTGTGSVTLAGAVTGYQSFAVVGNGNTCYYCISDQVGANWEVGIGTYSTTGPTLARTTVLASSNSGSLVTFTSNTKDVFLTQPVERAIYQDSSLSNTAYAPQLGASNGLVINNLNVATSYSIPSNYSAMSSGPITINSGVTVTVPSGSRWVVI